MTRNNKRSTELYSNLTSKEKAALSLGIYEADELDVIAGTVEKKTYRMMDAAFTDWSDYAFKISTVLGLSFWQANANEFKIKHGIRCAALMWDEEQTDTLKMARVNDLTAFAVEAMPKAQAKQKAALVALETLSEENGFHFKDCLNLAGIGLEEVERLETVEPSTDDLESFLSIRVAAPKL